MNQFVWKLRNLLGHRTRELKDITSGRLQPKATLSIVIIRANGTREDLGVVSRRLLTTAGVAYIAAAFNAGGAVNLFKYHGMGTGSVAENVSDTQLGAEVESRATGSQANNTNTYTTVGTITATQARAITEHGIFSASSNGTLLDRSVFAVLNLATNDAIQFTYVLTIPAGG